MGERAGHRPSTIPGQLLEYVRMRLITGLAAVAAVASASLSSPLHAQVRASELASVSQVVDGTKLTIEYSRPRARGRSPLFGTKIVQWNEVWTPGANDATTFALNKDVQLNGTPVAKGKYSVWLVVRQTGDWTMVLDPRAKLFHMDHPDSTKDQIRFPVKVAQVAPAVDVLTWEFPAIRNNGATVAMTWGTYRVTVDMTVTPTLSSAFPASDAAQYLGRFTFTKPDGSALPAQSDLVVLHENGTLMAEFHPTDAYMKRFALIRVAPDMFVPGIYDEHGEIYEVLRPDVMLIFTRTNGVVTGIEMRNADDKLEMKGAQAK
jgi:hypothetical protein